MKRFSSLLIVTIGLLMGSQVFADDEVEFDNSISDNYETFGEPLLLKDPGPAINPDDPIIASGDCSDYTDLTGMPLPISAFGTTVGASNDYGPFHDRPPCWHGDWPPSGKDSDLICAGPDAAFKWTAPASGDYTFSLCGAFYDNGLLLYRFTCPDEPTYPDDFICGADDNCYLRGKIRFVHLDEGEEILVVVDGYGNNADDFELRIYESEIDDDSLDWFMDMHLQTFHIPGAAACIVKDGQIVWSHEYGLANIEENRPVEDTTLFTLASVSKTVTVAAVMQLWEDGLFGLDDDVNDYLPFNVRNPDFPSTPVTFRSLLAHMSGINDNWDLLGTFETNDEDSPIPLGEFLENYLSQDGDYYYPDDNFNDWAPETAYDYCNVGVALAAYIVELLNPDGLSFSDYCREYILDPLGMNKSAWFLSDLNLENLAMPYVWNGSVNVPYGHFGHPWYPSGLLRSNVPELARHLMAFMQYGQIDDIRILDSTTVDLMTTIQYPDINDRRGLVWYWTYFGIRPVWGHGGVFPGVRTRMFFYPEENTGVILLTNGVQSDGLDPMVTQLFEYAGGPSGVIAGIVTDPDLNPIDNVYVKTIGFFRFDYSNLDGDYSIGGLISGTYDVRFRLAGSPDVTVEDVSVALGETTYVNAIMQVPCEYIAGDCNHNGVPLELSDVVTMTGFYRGSLSPEYVCDCPPNGDEFTPTADPNGNCVALELGDVVAEIAAYRGNGMPASCPDCP